MSEMTEPRELFTHELGDILYAEKLLVKVLPKLAKEATDPELVKGFESHLQETKQHVANLEQVFEQLGERAKAERCPGIEGIKAEHDEFMKEEKPSKEITDLFLTGAAARSTMRSLPTKVSWAWRRRSGTRRARPCSKGT